MPYLLGSIQQGKCAKLHAALKSIGNRMSVHTYEKFIPPEKIRTSQARWKCPTNIEYICRYVPWTFAQRFQLLLIFNKKCTLVQGLLFKYTVYAPALKKPTCKGETLRYGLTSALVQDLLSFWTHTCYLACKKLRTRSIMHKQMYPPSAYSSLTSNMFHTQACTIAFADGHTKDCCEKCSSKMPYHIIYSNLLMAKRLPVVL